MKRLCLSSTRNEASIMAATRSPLPPRPTSGGPIVVFFLMAFMAVANLVSALTVPADAIDHDRARGLRDG